MWIYFEGRADRICRVIRCEIRKRTIEDDCKVLRRRQWHRSSLLLPGEPHGQRSLGGYSLWGHKESDMTELVTHILLSLIFYFSFFPKNLLSSICWEIFLHHCIQFFEESVSRISIPILQVQESCPRSCR